MPFDFSEAPDAIRLFGIFPLSQPLEVSIYSLCTLSCSYCFSNLSRLAADDSLNMKNPTNALFSRIARCMADERDPVGFFLREKYPICFSNTTDPFQREEKKYRSSEAFLRWAQADEIPLWIQTKGNVLHEEFDRYAPFLAPGRDVVYISITHQDDQTRKRHEPGALSVEGRWELAAMLRARDIPVVIACNPYLKEWVPDSHAYCEKARDVGAAGIWWDPLHFTKAQAGVLPEVYKPLVPRANLSPGFTMAQVKQWYKACEDVGIDFFPAFDWDAHFGHRAAYAECCDPAWLGGKVFDPSDRVSRMALEVSRGCKDAPVMFSWPDIRALLEATGLPNPVLKTRPFWMPYNARINADYRSWSACLGKEAPLYEILRYFFNHPFENRNLVWHNPKMRALFDREKNLYVSDEEGDLIALFDPKAAPTCDFCIGQSEVDWDNTVWLDVREALGQSPVAEDIILED